MPATPADPTTTSPVADRLLPPTAVLVQEQASIEDDEEDRVTNPGPVNEAWQAAGAQDDDDPAWRAPNELAVQGLDEDVHARQRDAANLLRARPRRTAPATDDRRPAIEVDNARPAPLAHLEAPLFTDEVFVRPAVPRAARRGQPATAASRSWLGLLLAGAVILLLAAGWSVLSTEPAARSQRGEIGDRHDSARESRR